MIQKNVAKITALTLVVITIFVLSCGGGSQGPEELAAEYVESGNVEELEQFLDRAMLLGERLLDITKVETTLVSETDGAATVLVECSVGTDEARDSVVKITVELVKSDGKWVVVKAWIMD